MEVLRSAVTDDDRRRRCYYAIARRFVVVAVTLLRHCRGGVDVVVVSCGVVWCVVGWGGVCSCCWARGSFQCRERVCVRVFSAALLSLALSLAL